MEQLDSLLTEIDEQLAEIAPADEPGGDDTEDPARKPVRGPLPPALPRDVVAHPAPCGENGGCPACGGQLRALGRSETEILDYVPGTFRVIRHVRPKLSCRSCETIVQAPIPDQPIRRGGAGAGLIAHVLTAKYCDHQPLHGQAEQCAREDVDLSRSTLTDKAGQAARLLRPLVDALGRHVMSGQRIHADDTTAPVLSPGLGRTNTGRIWTHRLDDRPFGSTMPPGVFYRYTPDRKGEHPRENLRDFRGILQADGYAGFARIYDNCVAEAACVAHVWRKFFDVSETSKSSLARSAMDRIAVLYGIEAEIRGRPPDGHLVRGWNAAHLCSWK